MQSLNIAGRILLEENQTDTKGYGGGDKKQKSKHQPSRML